MRTRGFWLVALGLPLLLIGGSVSLGQAGEAEQKTQAPAVEKKTEEAPKESTQTAPASPAPAAPKASAEA